MPSSFNFFLWKDQKICLSVGSTYHEKPDSKIHRFNSMLFCRERHADVLRRFFELFFYFIFQFSLCYNTYCSLVISALIKLPMGSAELHCDSKIFTPRLLAAPRIILYLCRRLFFCCPFCGIGQHVHLVAASVWKFLYLCITFLLETRCWVYICLNLKCDILNIAGGSSNVFLVVFDTYTHFSCEKKLPNSSRFLRSIIGVNNGKKKNIPGPRP